MRNLRQSAFFAILAMLAVSSFGQNSNQWRTAADIHEGVRGSVVGTVADVDEARSQIQLDPDDATGGRVLVIADSLTTQYNNFGGVINNQPEIFTGSQGFANLRVGDRIEVRGSGRGTGSVVATFVTLLGRSVPADQTGVGTTRSPSAGASTPTATTTATRVGPVEGTVQQVNAAEGRIVIVTDRREVMQIRTPSGTPVYYRNNTYRVANLDVGDRVRIDPDTAGSSSGDIRARSIEVTRSVQEGSGTPVPTGTSVSGHISSIDRSVDMVTVDTGKQSIRVDVATAADTAGLRVRALDFKVGDQVSMNGHYSGTASDLFVADTVRWANEPAAAAPPPATTGGMPAGTDVTAGPPAAGGELPFVTIYGTVRVSLANSPQIVVRDSAGRSLRINVLEDFPVRNKGGAYIAADQLKVGDNVTIKAYRDVEGNYIAQTIRMR